MKFQPFTSPVPLIIPAAPTLPMFKAAVAGVKAGTRRATVLVIGDSTTNSQYAGNDGGDDAIQQNAWPTVMATSFSTAGLPALSNSFMGDAGLGSYSQTPSDFTVRNPLVSFVGTWFLVVRSSSPERMGLGGSPFVTTVASGGGAYATYSPPTTTNRCRFFFQQLGASPTVTLQVGTETAVNVSLGSGETTKVYDLTSVNPAAMNYYAFTNGGSGALCVQGAYAFNTAVPAVDVINAGNRGTMVADWADNTNGHSALNMITSVAPDLTIIMPPINDFVYGTPVSAFTSTLTTIVNKAKLSGDVLLVSAASLNYGGTYNGTTVPSKTVRDTYTAAISSVASAAGLPPITDLEVALGAWSSGAYYDALHPLKARYASMGQKVAADVLALIA